MWHYGQKPHGWPLFARIYSLQYMKNLVAVPAQKQQWHIRFQDTACGPFYEKMWTFLGKQLNFNSF